MSEKKAHQQDSLAGVAALPASAAGRGERLTITQVELFRVCPPLQPGILLAAAAPDFDVISHQRVHNLLPQPFEMHDSHIAVPDSPGLGVELDEDALRRYQVEG